MQNTKEEKIDIINTIIDIWGSINTSQLDLNQPIQISSVGNDKYSISLHISEYHINYVIIISYSDNNILGQEKMNYLDLPDTVIDNILTALIMYDAKMIDLD